jgi:hypothetical protein
MIKQNAASLRGGGVFVFGRFVAADEFRARRNRETVIAFFGTRAKPGRSCFFDMICRQIPDSRESF